MKKKIISILILLIVSITCFSLYACNEQPPAAFKKQENKGYATGFSKQVVSDYNVKYETDPTVTVDEEFKAELESKGDHYTKDDPYYDEDYDVTFKKVTATANWESLCAFGANADIFYPGALIDQKTEAPIEIQRAPLTIMLNGLEGTVNANLDIKETVDKPSLANVKNKIQTLVSRVFGENKANVPSRVTMEIKEIEDANEFALSLGFGIKYGAFDLGEQFDYKKNKKQTNLAIVLKQTYFDVAVSREGYGEYQFFDESIPKNQIREMIGDEKIPTYISSVSYGRMAIINISTNYTKQEIENQLSIGWNRDTNELVNFFTGGGGVSIDFQSALESIVENKDTEVRVWTYGGNNETAFDVISAGSDLGKIIDNFKKEYDKLFALPILYTFRHLDGTYANYQSAATYTVKDVKYNPKYLTDWSWFDTMLEDESIRTLETLKIDFLGMGKDNVNANRIIKVPSNIKTLVLRGGNDLYGDDLTYKNLSVEVAYRENPLTIVLEHININGYTQTEIKDKTPTGYDPKPFISCDVGVDITVKVVGDVCIRGGEGNPAIKVENLIISGSGKFDVYGGNGKDGADKGNFELGEGKATPILSTADKAGGDGGNGMPALQCKNITIAQDVESTTILRLYGGNGGNGGDGMSFTGEGSYDGHAYLPNGGNGGYGGNGGAPIDFSILQSFIMLNNEITQYYYFGNGGNGGNGGVGGSASDKNVDHSDFSGVGGRGGHGGSGYKAGAGGNGGKGGNKKHWYIIAALCSTCLQDDVNFVSGDGGNGGNAGSAINGYKIENGGNKTTLLGELGEVGRFGIRGELIPVSKPIVGAGIGHYGKNGINGIRYSNESFDALNLSTFINAILLDGTYTQEDMID
ncbi:MAG: hypothetical protein E7362_01110 [Clostridiales bacterium]|nr:hypothetical protein [Clostridiales bacterium]